MPARRKPELLAAVSFAILCPAVAEAREDQTPPGRATTLEEIVVTGRSLGQLGAEAALPVYLLTGEELAHRRQGGLGETLAGLPGVHLDNFGGGASRPVIRGQTVPRIEILTDGANLFDASSVSPDHAITTDPLLLDGIEVLRGPAATRFGGNALNGAINLIDSKVPRAVPVNGVTGGVEARYGSGDDEQALVGRVTAGTEPFAVHLEGSRRDSADYRVPGAYGSDRLRDSFAESSSFSFGGSWITSKGYLGVAYSRQDSEYGLPGHSHKNGSCHTHGLDLHCEPHDAWTDPFLGSDDTHTARIDLQSDRIDVRADYADLLPGIDHTRVRLSYTDYVHDEFDGEFRFSHYTNEVYDARVELTHAPILGFIGTFGGQYTDGSFNGININNAHEEVDFEDPFVLAPIHVPYIVTENVGLFVTERRSFGAVDLEVGLRKDWRKIHSPLPEYAVGPEIQPIIDGWTGDFWAGVLANHRRFYPTAEHDPFSASVAATWNLGNGYSAALSLAHTERAPNVRELYAYGNNLATNSYEVGLATTRLASSRLPASTTDVTEAADSTNLTFRKVGGPLEFEIGLFHQDIENYIFARLIETEVEGGAPHHYLVYTAADATFTGIDGQVSYAYSPESRITVFGDYVEADLSRENDTLPRIPPGRLGVRYNWTSGKVSTDLEYYRTFKQDQFASYETRTPGYDMVNATVGYRFDLASVQSLELYLRGTNLTNELGFAHTSFVKAQSPLRGRNLVLGLRYQF